MTLPWTIYLSFLGAGVLMLLPRDNARAARIVALLTALGGLMCALAGALSFDASKGITTLTKVLWVPALGLEYHLAADGISVTLILLTGIAAVAGILFSWNIEHRVKEFFAFYLALIGGVYGVFPASICSSCSSSTNWRSSRSISSSPSGVRPGRSTAR